MGRTVSAPVTAQPAALGRMLEEACGLATKNGVCQGSDAMDEIGMPCHVLSDTASCWCVTGALFAVGVDKPAQLQVAATWALAGEVDPGRGEKYRDAIDVIQDWADVEGRTADDVRALFEGALEGARTRRYVVSFDGDGDATVTERAGLRAVPNPKEGEDVTKQKDEAAKPETAAAISKKIAALRFKLKHAGTGRTGAPKAKLTKEQVADVNTAISALEKKRAEVKAAA